jgi:hypothetical protein
MLQCGLFRSNFAFAMVQSFVSFVPLQERNVGTRHIVCWLAEP